MLIFESSKRAMRSIRFIKSAACGFPLLKILHTHPADMAVVIRT